MSILPTWPIAVGALAVGLFGGAAGMKVVKDSTIAEIQRDIAEERRQRAAVQVADQAAARATEERLVASMTQTLQVKENEKAVIAGKLADATARLRERQERPVPRPGAATAPARDCQGSTGAELSRSDAGFLIGEAARADALRADLAACYRQYDDARALTDQYAASLKSNATTTRPQPAANR